MDATPKTGIVSTEFIATTGTVVAVVSDLVPEKYVPIVVGLVGLYVACRTLLKAVHTAGYAKQVPDLPDLPAAVIQIENNLEAKANEST